LSIEIASILAASIALGRFIAGFVLHRFAWFPVIAACLLSAAGLVLLALPLAHNATGVATGWADAPLGAFIFPMIGLFLSPIYPVINSTVLTALPAPQHGAMSGLSVIFSALGGTTGSLVNGFVFDALGGQTAFYFSLIPIASLLIALFFFNRLQSRSVVRMADAHA
jgi:fucose permease